MPTAVLKLFAGQGTGRTDRRTKRQLYAFPFEEHKKVIVMGINLNCAALTSFYANFYKVVFI